MPLRKSRPELPRSATAPVPGLTRQSSFESVGSPITPGHDMPTTPLDRDSKINIGTALTSHNAYPFPTPTSTPTTTAHFTYSNCTLDSQKTPSKDLPFLSQDPFAKPQDNDHAPFDKTKPILPSRSGSVRSIMSTNSIQSLKRGLSSIKRKLTRRGRSRPPMRRAQTADETSGGQSVAEDGITPVNRAQTYMMGPSFHHHHKQPRRVETYQVMAMAI